MNEIYLVQCEYTNKAKNIFETSQAGCSFDYEVAKKRLHDCIEEEIGEGNIPEDFDGWADDYKDFFTYENDDIRLLYYVCSVDVI